MPLIPAFRRWRQEDGKFEVSLGYIVGPSQRTKQNKTKGKNVVLV
jgi:hypothetical protein